MKKCALAAFAAFTLIACHNDDDSASSEVSLYGTWKLKSIIIPQGLDLNGDGVAGNDLVAESGCMNNSTIVFTNDVASAAINMQEMDIEQATDGSYSANCSAPEHDTSPFTVAGTTVTFTFEGEQVAFLKSGNTLTASQDGSSLIFKKL